MLHSNFEYCNFFDIEKHADCSRKGTIWKDCDERRLCKSHHQKYLKIRQYLSSEDYYPQK
jgi:hypothetical protein